MVLEIFPFLRSARRNGTSVSLPLLLGIVRKSELRQKTQVAEYFWSRFCTVKHFSIVSSSRSATTSVYRNSQDNFLQTQLPYAKLTDK